MKFNEILEEIKLDNQHPTEIKEEEVIKEVAEKMEAEW